MGSGGSGGLKGSVKEGDGRWLKVLARRRKPKRWGSRSEASSCFRSPVELCAFRGLEGRSGEGRDCTGDGSWGFGREG